MRLFAFLGGLAIAAALLVAGPPIVAPAIAGIAAAPEAPAMHMAAELFGHASAVLTLALLVIVLALAASSTVSAGFIGRIVLRLVHEPRRESTGPPALFRPPRQLC